MANAYMDCPYCGEPKVIAMRTISPFSGNYAYSCDPCPECRKWPGPQHVEKFWDKKDEELKKEESLINKIEMI